MTLPSSLPLNAFLTCCLGLAVVIAGCSSPASNAREPVSSMVTRTGTLATNVMQHPTIMGEASIDPESGAVIIADIAQLIVDLHDDSGATQQIIVTHPADMVVPTEAGRLIHLTGTTTTYDVGGAPGTKGEYTGQILQLHSWHYAEPQ